MNIILIILGFVILYYIIKQKQTTYKYTELVVLKHDSKSINLIGDIPDLRADKIYIQKVEKFVFGKLEETKLELKKEYYISSLDEMDETW